MAVYVRPLERSYDKDHHFGYGRFEETELMKITLLMAALRKPDLLKPVEEANHKEKEITES